MKRTYPETPSGILRGVQPVSGIVTRFLAIASISVMAALIAGCPPLGPSGNDNDNDNVNDNTSDDGVELRAIADGLASPVGLVPVADGSDRLFVLDQIGVVRIINAEGELEPEPFLDIRDRTVELMTDFDERGLLGLAFHPDYDDNGRFFVFYTAAAGPDTPEGFDSQTHISEFQVSGNPNIADAGSERILLTIDKPQFNHNGGQLDFGPDGYLYISVGDGGGANDVGLGHTLEIGNALNRLTLLGKILRIDVDSGDPYSIPSDNPFADQDDSRPEIWALGLRNPWRASFDQGGSHRLFVGDAGQDAFEEVNIVERGGNYGWNVKEGSHCFDADAPGEPPESCPEVSANGDPFIDPIIEYSHFTHDVEPIGVVVIGGYVYRGDALPSFDGQYIFGDYSVSFDGPGGRLFIAAEDTSGEWTMRNLAVGDDEEGGLGAFLLGFGQDLDGEVYVLTTQVVGPSGTTGRVLKIVPAD